MIAQYQTFLAELPKPEEFKSELDLAMEKGPVAGVYILIHNEVTVYVGHSGFLQERIRCHRREKTKVFHTFKYYQIDSVLSRLYFEGILILALRPKYNRALSLGFAPGKIWELKYNIGKGKARTTKPTRPTSARPRAKRRQRPLGACEAPKGAGIQGAG